MKRTRKALLSRFLDGAKPRRKRRDGKGNRVSLKLRISERLAEDLDIIKTAGGEDKNSFCNRSLEKAANERKTKLREEYEEAAWKGIEASIRARKGKGPAC